MRPCFSFRLSPLRPLRLAGGFETQQVKQMLQDWNQRFPGSNDSMFAALGNIAPSCSWIVHFNFST